jgi:hypothetical protein
MCATAVELRIQWRLPFWSRRPDDQLLLPPEDDADADEAAALVPPPGGNGGGHNLFPELQVGLADCTVCCAETP